PWQGTTRSVTPISPCHAPNSVGDVPIRFSPVQRLTPWICVMLALALAAGCGSSQSYEKFIPSESAARRALETVLASWQKGEKPGTIWTAEVPVEVIDSKWKSGQKLASLE